MAVLLYGIDLLRVEPFIDLGRQRKYRVRGVNLFNRQPYPLTLRKINIYRRNRAEAPMLVNSLDQLSSHGLAPLSCYSPQNHHRCYYSALWPDCLLPSNANSHPAIIARTFPISARPGQCRQPTETCSTELDKVERPDRVSAQNSKDLDTERLPAVSRLTL